MKTIELKRQLGWMTNAKRLVEHRDTEHHLLPYYEQALEALREQIAYQEQHQPFRKSFTTRAWTKKATRA